MAYFQERKYVLWSKKFIHSKITFKAGVGQAASWKAGINFNLVFRYYTGASS